MVDATVFETCLSEVSQCEVTGGWTKITLQATQYIHTEPAEVFPSSLVKRPHYTFPRQRGQIDEVQPNVASKTTLFGNNNGSLSRDRLAAMLRSNCWPNLGCGALFCCLTIIAEMSSKVVFAVRGVRLSQTEEDNHGTSVVKSLVVKPNGLRQIYWTTVWLLLQPTSANHPIEIWHPLTQDKQAS